MHKFPKGIAEAQLLDAIYCPIDGSRLTIQNKDCGKKLVCSAHGEMTVCLARSCPKDIRYFRGKYKVMVLRRVQGVIKTAKGHTPPVCLVRFLESTPRFKEGQEVELIPALLFRGPTAGIYQDRQRATKLGVKNPNWKGDSVSPQNARDRARRLLGTKEGFDIHHKDGDPYNNAPENLEYQSRKGHMASDGRLEKLIQRNKQGDKEEKFCPICGCKLSVEMVDGKRKLKCETHGEMKWFLDHDPFAAAAVAEHCDAVGVVNIEGA